MSPFHHEAHLLLLVPGLFCLFQVYVQLRGLVDFDVEISKLKKQVNGFQKPTHNGRHGD